MADNYLEFVRWLADAVLADVGRDRIGYNRADNILFLRHDSNIANNGGVASLHEADNSTDYQNLTTATVYAIVSMQLGSASSEAKYKIYSAPITDSIAGADEVFDSLDILPSTIWITANTFLTSYLVPIQPNHFIVVENTGTVGTGNINLLSPAAQTTYGVVIEPA